MISVLTTTYNRAYTLPRLYESLCMQRSKNFEWVIVDDGSEDDTRTMISLWCQETSVSIRYLCQENSGKMLAVNKGVEAARGNYILIVDSDDMLTPDAIECVLNILKKHDEEERGYIFRRENFSGQIIGNRLSQSRLSLTPTEASRRLNGDLAYVLPRKMLKKYPFPAIPGEKFVPELYIWNKIGDDIPFFCYPQKVIYRCEYLSDGYSHNFLKIFKANPRGFLLFYKDQFFREKGLSRKVKMLLRTIQGYVYLLLKRMRGKV